MVYFIVMAICILMAAFGLYLLRRSSRCGQSIADFGMGWMAIVLGVISGVLCSLVRFG